MATTDVDLGDRAEGGIGRFIVPAVLVAILAALGWAVSTQIGKGDSGPKRQTVKIAVLPDTPPPPPPPPKEEKKPEPRPEENKPRPQEQPKPVEAPPEPQQLKMEGAAGDGPSAFGSGAVNSEYKGGEIGTGAGGQATLGDRMAALNYGNAARRELNSFLSRDEGLRRLGDYKVPIGLWLRADGAIERFEIQGSSGNPEIDQLLNKAMKRFPGFRGPPPPNIAWPMRVQLTSRSAG